MLACGWDGKSNVHETWDYNEPDNPSTGASRTIIRFGIKAATREELGVPDFTPEPTVSETELTEADWNHLTGRTA